MGKASKNKKTLDNAGKSQAVCQISTQNNNSFFLKPVVQATLIIILGIIVYSNTFTSPFVFDDGGLYIVKNPAIKDINYFFNSDKIANADIGPTFKAQFKNRIFGHFTFWMNYKINGLDVKGYHLVNLLIHLFNALLVYMLIRLTFRTPFLENRISNDKFNWQRNSLIAFLCSLLFVVHPIQTQAVTYISQRFTSLVAFFYLLSLVLYIKARLSETSFRSYLYYFVSFISVVFAMKTKEISFTLPVVIVLYEIMFFEGSLKKRICYLLPFLLTMAIIPLSLLSSELSNNIFDNIGKVSKETIYISRTNYLYTQFAVIITYLRLLFFPVNQNLDYDYPLYSSFFIPHVYLSFFMLLSILVFGGYLFYRSREKNRFSWYFRLISFGIFWFFITLSVESSIIPIRDLIFEHRVYLPSFGFFLSVITCLFMFQNKIKNSMFSKTIVPILFSIVIILAGLAYARNAIWKSNISLWEDTVKKSPLKARPHYSLAFSYRNKSSLRSMPNYNPASLSDDDYRLINAAINEYLITIKINPDYFEAHRDLGEIYSKIGFLKEAVNECLIAIKLKPEDVATHNQLGMTYYKLGRLKEAVDELRIAIKLKPDDAEIHSNFGIIYSKLGRMEDAITEYRRAIELKPNDAELHMNLGAAYYKQGRLKDACKETLHAIKLDPNNIDAHYNLAIYYTQQEKFTEAIEEYSIVTKLDPNNEEARSAIGVLAEYLKMQLKSTKK